MTLPKIFGIVIASGLVSVGCTQVKPEREAVAIATPFAAANRGADRVGARMDAKWVSAIRGMKVETPEGAFLGRVQDVIIDGYGYASFAIVSYGGVMGFGIQHTAVPWATVAGILDRDRLHVDQSSLENAPLLSSANPQSGDRNWRHAAETYWNGKVAVAE